jgi:hypothetical protein
VIVGDDIGVTLIFIDLVNNTREYLLAHFSVAEGKSALGKAQINKQLYDALKNYGE